MREEEPIRDEEMSRYFRAHYEEEVAEKISETTFGKKIKKLEKLNIGVSFNNIIERYLRLESARFDEFGNVSIDETSVAMVYNSEVEAVSKVVGFDISKMELGEIEELTTQYFNGELDNDERIVSEIIKEQSFEKILEIIGFDKNNDTFMTSSQIIDLLSGYEEFNLSKEEAENIVSANEKRAVENNVETETDVDLLELAYNIKLFSEKGNKMEKESLGSLTQIYINQIREIAPNSKFGKRLLDENKEITVESVCEFIETWENERNEVKLYDDITKYLGYNASDVNNENMKDIATIFLRVARGTNADNRILAMKLSKQLGIEVLAQNGSNFVIPEIEKFCKKVFGKDADLNEIYEQSQTNMKTKDGKFKRIREYIKAELDGNLNVDHKSRDGLLKGRQTIAGILKNNIVEFVKGNCEERICSKREKIIYDVLNSVNAGNLNKNSYENEATVKNVVALYCKFREDEIQKNKGDKYNGLDGNSMNSGGEYANSAIVKKFMIENSEYFGEYLTDLDRIDHKAVMKDMRGISMGANQMANFSIAYKQITRRTAKIDRNQKKENGKITDLTRELENYYKIRNENGEADVSLEDNIFDLARKISVDALSTDMLIRLSGLNKEKFDMTFMDEKTQRAVGTNTIRAGYFAAARLFSKLYYIPDIIMNRAERQSELPTIKKNAKEEKAKKREEKRAEQERKKAERKIEQAEKKKVQEEKREQKKSQQAQKETERRIKREQKQMDSNSRKGLKGILGNLIGKDETKLLDTGNIETTREQISNAEMHTIESENNGKSFATETYENGFIQKVYVDHKLALEKTESARKDQAKTSRGNVSGNIEVEEVVGGDR